MSVKPVKCYYCGELIEPQDLVIKPFPLICQGGKKRNYKRKFHISCLPKYIANTQDASFLKEERNQMWEVCQYFKDNILKYDAGIPLSKHAIQRIQGLHIGQYKPNGNNVNGLKRGYSYNVILYTMKVCAPVLNSTMNNMTFNNDEHKVNYAMKYISSKINLIDEKIKLKKKTDKQVESINVNVGESVGYVKRGGNTKFKWLEA